MYRCICNAIKQEYIDELVKLGLTEAEACARLSVGTNCGRCLETVPLYTSEEPNDN